MSWDSRTWTIRGDDHDTVRLVGYESSWTQSDGQIYEYFEPFRYEGQQTIDGVVYNVYDLWDARVLIEDGVDVIYKKRDLEKLPKAKTLNLISGTSGEQLKKMKPLSTVL